MADISSYLADIMAAVYGEDVRGSIHDAIEIINDVSEVVLTTGTAVTGPTSSSTGFYDDSLYLNTSTMELWKCVGTNLWQSQGVLKGDPGAAGVGISSIDLTSSVGLVDTYTITYTDSTTTTFTVTNGQDGTDGEDGNKWYRGTAISGKDPNPTVFSGSGITLANPNDFYLNPTEGAVYHCVTGGNASTATWSYDFTMTGGGGGGTSNYNDLTNKPQIAGTTLSGNKSLSDLGIQGALTAGNGIDITGSTISADMGTTGTTVAAGNHTHSASIATSSGTSDVDMAANTKYALTMGGNSVIFKTPPNPSVPDELSDLTGDVAISTPTNGQVLTYDSANSKWKNQNPASGGHTMIDTVADIEALTDGDDDYVVNGYAIKQWSNCDDIQLLVAVSADDDGIGTWEDDDDWETSGVRTGWIQHASLHGILSDDDVLVEPVFKVPSGKNNAVSAYAMRVDDGITGSLGGVALKFNAPITANGYAGVRIRHLRTNTIILTP